jgi:hypothetical protein
MYALPASLLRTGENMLLQASFLLLQGFMHNLAHFSLWEPFSRTLYDSTALNYSLE